MCAMKNQSLLIGHVTMQRVRKEKNSHANGPNLHTPPLGGRRGLILPLLPYYPRTQPPLI
jgi:hypothetical protein